MEIRPYNPDDRTACIELCQSLGNGTDAAAFAKFLDLPPTHFFVAEHDGRVLACGGFTLDETRAELLWGMVGKPWQRQGIGRFLLFHRLREIGRLANVELVQLRAPAGEAAFFAKQGFRETAHNGQTIGMTKRLTVCT